MLHHPLLPVLGRCTTTEANMAKAQVVITDEAAIGTVEKYSTQMECSKAEGAARLIAIAKSRINALRKYADKQSEPAKPAKKKAKKAAKAA